MEDVSFISLSQFIEYWHLISEYVNIGTIFLYALLGGILGFVVVLVAEIIWCKRITVKRRYKFLQYFTYLYFIFFPFYAGFCFSQWFGFHAIEKQIVKNIPSMLGGSNALFNEYVKDELEKMIGKENLNITASQLVDKGLDATSDLLKATAIDSDSITPRERTTMEIASILVKSDAAKNQVKSTASGKMGDALGVSKTHAEEFMTTEVASILESGLVNSILEKKIKGIFGGLKLQVFFIFLIGMALPISEIVLAHYLERKRAKEKLL